MSQARFVLALLLVTVAGAAIAGPPAKPPRAGWTMSRVKGSPEPPPPYRTERVFPKIEFKHPLLIKLIPGTNRYIVAEQDGKLYSFVNSPEASTFEPVIDVFKEVKSIPDDSPHQRGGQLYGFAFHPKFAENQTVFACYVMGSKRGKQEPDGSRVSRFTLKGDPPRIDPASEEVVFSWLGGGHNGGSLEFGPDNFLYISTGDGSFTNPPDALLAGQDMTQYNSKILRIDIDRKDPGKNYALPKDNPFLPTTGDPKGEMKPEIWALGFRNPWRMTFDSATGDLWVGDVGWELYELVYNVERGGNYGWSVMEGHQSVRPEAKRGPTSITPPAVDLPHSMAASVTAGYVYHGKALPELEGRYVFGDWETRRMWAVTWDRAQKKVTQMDELVEPTLRIVCYGETPERELLIMDYDDGTIHQLVKNVPSSDQPPFPTKLSETGLFNSVPQHAPAAGVLPFSINAEQWADGALAERLLGLPDTSSVLWHNTSVPIPGTIFKRELEFPKDTVLAKTMSLELERGNPVSRKRVETQVLHFNGRIWRGYSYAWNDEQTDATLVDAEGADKLFTITETARPGGAAPEKHQQTYQFTARAACVRCHNPWAQHALAFAVPQINRDVAGHNQLTAFEQAGVVVRKDATIVSQTATPALTNPYDETADLTARARSYLQANCAHCHQIGGGGTADIELRYEFPIDQTKTLGVRPLQGTFGIHEAHILSPGDPYRSALYFRMSKLGKGRMPHIGSNVLDHRGLRLMHDWITQLPLRKDEAVQFDRLLANEESAARKAEEAGRAERRLKLAEQLARGRINKERKAAGTPELAATDEVAPTDAEREQAATRDAKEQETRTKKRQQERTDALTKLLNASTSSLRLARELQENRLSESTRDELLKMAAVHADLQVQDLFEQFLPEEKRPKKLGSVVRVNELLNLPGDAARGRKLYFETATVQCKACHRVGEVGSKLGPELTQIGKKPKAQILESILEPSKQVDPKFVTYLVETTDGKVITGLLVERTEKEVVLRNAKDELVKVAAADVETVVPQRQSLMPELQLRDMTKEQVADLLEFLSSLK